MSSRMPDVGFPGQWCFKQKCFHFGDGIATLWQGAVTFQSRLLVYILIVGQKVNAAIVHNASSPNTGRLCCNWLYWQHDFTRICSSHVSARSCRYMSLGQLQRSHWPFVLQWNVCVCVKWEMSAIHRYCVKLMADGPSFLYKKLARESWYKNFVRVS